MDLQFRSDVFRKPVRLRAAAVAIRAPQQRAGRRCRVRHRRQPRQDRRRPPAAARDRRRRLRQDADAGGARRPPRAGRRRPVAHPPAHFLAARCPRNGNPGRPRPSRGARHGAAAGRAAVAVVRHLPQHRCPLAAPPCRPRRPRRLVYRRRPRRLRRPAASAAAAARPRRRRHPLSAEGDLFGDLFARCQRPSRPGRGARHHLPVVRRPPRRPEALVRGLRCREAGAARARLRRPARLVGNGTCRAGAGGRDRGPLRPRARRRVPGHQPHSGRDRVRAAPRRPRPHRRRRRRPVDLFVSCRRGQEHPRLRDRVLAAGDGAHARPKLSLDGAAAGSLERGHRAGGRAPCQDVVERGRGGREAVAGVGRGRVGGGCVGRRAGSGVARIRPGAEEPGGALSQRQPQPCARARAGTAEHPVREVRRPEVSRLRSRQGRVGRAPIRGEPARPAGGAACDPAGAGNRQRRRRAPARRLGDGRRSARRRARRGVERACLGRIRGPVRVIAIGRSGGLARRGRSRCRLVPAAARSPPRRR